MYLLNPFIVQSFKTILSADPKLWDATFLGLKWPVAQVRFFSKKPLITSWPLSLCKISKKSMAQTQSYQDAPLLGQKYPICPKRYFFRNLVAFIIMSSYKKAGLDLNPLTRYWQLTNIEVWLAKSIFGGNLKTIFFPHIQFLQNAKGKGHKYFRSTPFPGQNWWTDFPKKSKNPILESFLMLESILESIFGHFCWKGIFTKTDCHAHLHMGP